MRNPFVSSLRIDITSTSIAFSKVKGFFRQKIEIIDKTDENISVVRSQIGQSLQDKLADLKISEVNTEVVIPDEWVRYFSVTPPTNAQNLHDCLVAAKMRFHSLYEDNLAEWSLSADWNAQSNFITCAVPNALIDTLKDVEKHRKLSLYSVRPHFIAACNRWRKRLKKDDWFCVMRGDIVSTGIFSENRLFAIRVSQISSDCDRSNTWFQEHIVREALRLNVQFPPQVQLYIDRSVHLVADSKDTIRVEKMDVDFYRVHFSSEIKNDS